MSAARTHRQGNGSRRSPGTHRAALAATAAAFALLMPRPGSAQGIPSSRDCIACHLTLDEERLVKPARSYPEDVHAQRGFDCLACHGGAETAKGAPDPGAPGFLSKPDRRDLPEMCGRCHSDASFMREYNPSLRVDQVSEYRTSVHGRLLMEEGNPDVATCVDCHPAHRILPPTDPESTVYPLNVPETCGSCHADTSHMAGYDLPTDQLDRFRSSVHGRLIYEEGDLSAPVCNDCHGNHGAAPPEVSSVRNVCGQCHTVMADYFRDSGHVDLFNDADLPLCVTCHGNHDIQAVSDAGLQEKARTVCVQCHEADDDAGRTLVVMASMLDSLTAVAAAGREQLLAAENAGMEVSQALFELDDVNNSLTRARNAIHSFNIKPFKVEIDKGMDVARTAEERAVAAMDEHRLRRVGLAASAAIIFLLIVGILLKLRQIDERVEETMAAIDSFFDERMAPNWAGTASGDRRITYAACALLLEVVLSDDRVRAERGHTQDLVVNRFAPDKAGAHRLVQLIEEQDGEPVRMGQFAHLIAKQYGDDKVRAVLEEVWSLVYSDARLTHRETVIMEGLTYLLDVPTEEAAAARRTVERTLT